MFGGAKDFCPNIPLTEKFACFNVSLYNKLIFSHRNHENLLWRSFLCDLKEEDFMCFSGEKSQIQKYFESQSHHTNR